MPIRSPTGARYEKGQENDCHQRHPIEPQGIPGFGLDLQPEKPNLQKSDLERQKTPFKFPCNHDFFLHLRISVFLGPVVGAFRVAPNFQLSFLLTLKLSEQFHCSLF